MTPNTDEELEKILRDGDSYKEIVAALKSREERLVREARVEELESLPFTDRELGCMDCLAASMVEDRIIALKKGE